MASSKHAHFDKGPETPAAWKLPLPGNSRCLETPAAWKLPEPGNSRSPETPGARKLPEPGNFRSPETSAARKLPLPGNSRSPETPAARKLPQHGNSRSPETPAARKLPQHGNSRSTGTPAARELPQHGNSPQPRDSRQPGTSAAALLRITSWSAQSRLLPSRLSPCRAFCTIREPNTRSVRNGCRHREISLAALRPRVRVRA